jgi:dinuclear metal center YbgI/SA1388 family protein
MTLNELDFYFDGILQRDKYEADPSQNGIQVENESPDTKDIHTVAFAVDACLETIERCVQAKAQVLVVHHGLFWKQEQVITKGHYKRISTLIKNNIALYASHIPLDANTLVGNNYGIASRLNLSDCQSFGFWRGMDIGVKGALSEPLSIDKVISLLFPDGEKPHFVLPFGKKEIQTVGIVSGGGADDLEDAIAENLDLFITGEIGHEQYHSALENKINVIAGGHYQTETVGVNLLRLKLEKEKNIKTVFIDVPTGL